VVENLQRTSDWLRLASIDSRLEQTVTRSIQRLTAGLYVVPKTWRWEIRAKLGKALRWYSLVETGGGF
jgi:hypothetical protein